MTSNQSLDTLSFPATPSNRARTERLLDWWNGKNIEPLVYSYARVPSPVSGLDIDVPPQEMLARKLKLWEYERSIPNDSVLTARVEVSMGFLPALCGAGFEYDKDTSWSIPCYQSIHEVKFPPFTDTHPLMQAYLARWQPIADNWSWDTFLPGMMTMFGPSDLLSGLLGAETLARETMDNPDMVRGKALEAAEWMRSYIQYDINLRRKAGLTGGLPTAFRHWLPGDGFQISEDFSVLISRHTFRNLFLEANHHLVQGFDHTLFHIHTVGDQILPAVLDSPFFQSMEISNDTNNTDLDSFIRNAQSIQERGFPVQLSNWEHPLPRARMEEMLSALNPQGLLIGFTSENLSEAWEIYHWVKDFYKRA